MIVCLQVFGVEHLKSLLAQTGTKLHSTMPFKLTPSVTSDGKFVTRKSVCGELNDFEQFRGMLTTKRSVVSVMMCG